MRSLARAADRVNGTSASTVPPSSRTCIAHPAQLRRPPIRGVLGGLAGLSGPLPTIWATLRGWGKDERRAVFQAYNLAVLAVVVALHAASGLVTAELGWLAVVALPGTLAGAWLGARAYRRLSDQRFHEVVLGLLGVSGLTLVWASV